MPRSSFWLLLVLTAGCINGYPSSWDREEMILPGNLPPEQQVKIWSADSVFWWHAVVYTRDSITGIPYTIPTTCDSCRIALPRQAVDSIRVGNPPSLREYQQQEAGSFVAAMVLVGILEIALAIFHIGK
jgi:hypothetical protein